MEKEKKKPQTSFLLLVTPLMQILEVIYRFGCVHVHLHPYE